MLMERDDAREQLLVRQREAAISLCFSVEGLGVGSQIHHGFLLNCLKPKESSVCLACFLEP